MPIANRQEQRLSLKGSVEHTGRAGMAFVDYSRSLTGFMPEGFFETNYGSFDMKNGLFETDYGLFETNYGLLETNYGLLETDYGLLETDYGLLGTNYGLLGTDYGSLLRMDSCSAGIDCLVFAKTRAFMLYLS